MNPIVKERLSKLETKIDQLSKAVTFVLDETVVSWREFRRRQVLVMHGELKDEDASAALVLFITTQALYYSILEVVIMAKSTPEQEQFQGATQKKADA